MFARLQLIRRVPGSRLLLTALCSLLLLPVVVAAATADQNVSQKTSSMAVDKDTGVITLHVDIEKSTIAEVKQSISTSCQATILINYQQLNTVASVEGTVENTMCGASSGDFELAISLKDPDGGDPKVLEFTEKWQRSDSQAVKFSGNYPIGDNAELLRVRARKLHCICTGAATN